MASRAVRALGAPLGRRFSSGARAGGAARRIELYDTTLRDGTQGEGVCLSLHDKLAIAERLDDMGFDYIEGGFPLSNEKDVAFFREVRTLNLRRAAVCAFGMTRRRGISAAEDVGMQSLLRSEAPVITIVGKTWDFHVTHVLNVSLEENLAMISESVAAMIAGGRRCIYDAEHFFDGWKANEAHARATMAAAAAAGAETIALCDTNGGTMPDELARIVRAAKEALAEWPAVSLGVHCHNDCELAVANSLAAVGAGASQVQGTVNGIGERCGNADLLTVAANLALKFDGAYRVLGPAESLPIARLTDLSRFVYDTANLSDRSGQPYVGRSAFAHKGGMHAHAMQLAPTSYEHIDPASVGNVRRILVSELSGRSNVAALTAKHKIEDPMITKAILEQVQLRESMGYQYEAAQASFELVVQKCAGTFAPHFKRIKYHVEIASFGGAYGGVDEDAPDANHLHDEISEATVKIALPNGREVHQVSEGKGPVAALDSALRKALDPYYPNLRDLKLVDYKVRVVSVSEQLAGGTGAAIRVIVTSRDRTGDRITTVGVGTNIIEATWRCLVDAIEFKLHREDGRKTKADRRSVILERVASASPTLLQWPSPPMPSVERQATA